MLVLDAIDDDITLVGSSISNRNTAGVRMVSSNRSNAASRRCINCDSRPSSDSRSDISVRNIAANNDLDASTDDGSCFQCNTGNQRVT